MKLLVCGGRDYADKQKLYDTLDKIDREHGITAIIHGNAKGADTLAGQWARDNEISEWAFSAEWKRLGNAAGMIRNQKMIDDGKPDAVVAFPGGKGTADMVRRAKAANLYIIIVE